MVLINGVGSVDTGVDGVDDGVDGVDKWCGYMVCMVWINW